MFCFSRSCPRISAAEFARMTRTETSGRRLRVLERIAVSRSSSPRAVSFQEGLRGDQRQRFPEASTAVRPHPSSGLVFCAALSCPDGHAVSWLQQTPLVVGHGGHRGWVPRWRLRLPPTEHSGWSLGLLRKLRPPARTADTCVSTRALGRCVVNPVKRLDNLLSKRIIQVLTLNVDSPNQSTSDTKNH